MSKIPQGREIDHNWAGTLCFGSVVFKLRALDEEEDKELQTITPAPIADYSGQLRWHKSVVPMISYLSRA